jgi:hypothetical protein
MQARTELEALELEIGGAAVRLKDRGLTWTKVAEGLGVRRAEPRERCVAS